MGMTDPIADFLTRIRNGLLARQGSVTLPASKLKLELVRILRSEGFISNFKLDNHPTKPTLTVHLKYVDGNAVISELKRVSKPGCRAYCHAEEIRPVRNGLGLAIYSTNMGIMTDKQAREKKVGGEWICSIW